LKSSQYMRDTILRTSVVPHCLSQEVGATIAPIL
jgi:hypothetical protein